MGEVTPVGDHTALAQAIGRILDNKSAYLRSSELIAESFTSEATASAYMDLFHDLQSGTVVKKTVEPAVYDNLRTMRDQHEASGTTL
jgi:hypothetical protein